MIPCSFKNYRMATPCGVPAIQFLQFCGTNITSAYCKEHYTPKRKGLDLNEMTEDEYIIFHIMQL